MKLSLRKTLLLYTLSPILLIFLIFSLENIWDTHTDSSQNLDDHIGDLSYSFASLFNEIIIPIAALAESNSNLISQTPNMTKSQIYIQMSNQLKNSHIAYGVWVAFAPYQFDEKTVLVAPYVYRNKNNKIIQKDFGSYDYTSGKFEFWEKAVTSKKGGWTEPYLAKVGGVLMSSYVVPIYRNNTLIGVSGIDIPLHEISNHIQIPGMNEYSVVVLSSAGNIILFGSEQEFIGRSVFDYLDFIYEQTIKLHPLDKHQSLMDIKMDSLKAVKKLISSQSSGKIEIKTLHEEENFWYFYSPIQSPGWVFAIKINKSHAYKDTYERILHTLIFLVLLLLLISIIIFIASGKISEAFEWLIDRCMRIERMNFQSFDNKEFNITEINQLSNTLSQMSQALSSHFNNNEESQIAQAIRSQTLPDTLIAPNNYEVDVFTWLNKNSYAETYDAVYVKEGDINSIHSYLFIDSSEIMLEAGIKNTYIKAIFNTCIYQGCALTKIADYINNVINKKLMLPGPLQLWMASIDPKTNSFKHLNLGTNTVLYYSASKHEVLLLEQYPFTFLGDHKKQIKTQSICLQSGDIILLASDGITGALNRERKAFGQQILEQILIENHQENTKTLLNIISTQLTEFIGDNILEDDRTLILVKYLPE